MILRPRGERGIYSMHTCGKADARAGRKFVKSAIPFG
jgi:hypothetical protein